MFKFTKTGVFCLLVILIFCLLQIFIYQIDIEPEVNAEIMEQVVSEQEIKPLAKSKDETYIWKIEIPKISVSADIAEGTSKEILKHYVGHFENTSKEQGNIGLATCNRVYTINDFEDLKKLKEGDEIKYKHNEFEKIYEVHKCRIIKDTEWQYLEESEKNMLTLITYVENYPEYRRCIQAVEKE